MLPKRRTFGNRNVVSNKINNLKMTESSTAKSLDMFIAYSREDEQYRVLLEKHLVGLERQGLINPWHDGKIEAGKEWEAEIEVRLSQADIILLLISVDFLSSDYCYHIEMEKALKRHTDGEAEVIPIIVRPCHWEDSPFSKLQVLPNKGKAISTWGLDVDSPLKDIAKNLNELIKKIKKEKELYHQKLSFEIKELEKKKSFLQEEVTQMTLSKQTQIEIISSILEVKTSLEGDYLDVLKSSIKDKIAAIKTISDNFENTVSDWVAQLKNSMDIIKEEDGKIKNIEKARQEYLKNLQLSLDGLQTHIEKINESKKSDLSETSTQTSEEIEDGSIDIDVGLPFSPLGLNKITKTLKWIHDLDKK